MVSNKLLFQIYCTISYSLFLVYLFDSIEIHASSSVLLKQMHWFTQLLQRTAIVNIDLEPTMHVVSNKNNKSESKREKKRLKITLHPTWESRHLSFLFAILSKGNEKEPNQRIGGARKLKPWGYFYTPSSVWLQLFQALSLLMPASFNFISFERRILLWKGNIFKPKVEFVIKKVS